MIVNVSAPSLDAAFKIVAGNGYQNIVNVDNDLKGRYQFSVDNGVIIVA